MEYAGLTGKVALVTGAGSGIFFLASDAAGHSTSTAVWIDGGSSLIQD